MSTVNTNPTEISVMLDELELPAAALRWKELSESPAYCKEVYSIYPPENELLSFMPKANPCFFNTFLKHIYWVF